MYPPIDFLEGPLVIAAYAKLDELSHQKPIIVFDEIHKFKKWKSFLKGFYDTYHQKTQIIVTGSSRLKIFKPGGDSLMGRYFSYKNLVEFQKQLDAPHAFQVVMDLPYVDKNCFEATGPIVVPGENFLIPSWV